MNAVDLLQSALDDLPDDPGEIAAKLEANGIHSVLRCPRSCAITDYLQGRLGAAGFEGSVRVLGPSAYFKTSGVPRRLEVPARVLEFIKRFDRGEYPMLVDVERSRVYLQSFPYQMLIERGLRRLDEIKHIQKENT